MFGTDPEDWLREQEARAAELSERAGRVQDDLRAASTTVSSQDRSVTLTVNAGGQLQSLQLSPRAQKLTMLRLASTIMTTYQRACAQAAQSTIALMSDLVGNDSEAMEFLRQQLPPDPDAEDAEGTEDGR